LDQSGRAVGDTTNAAADTVSNQLMGQTATSSVVSGDAAAIAGAVPDELLRALHLDASNPLVRAAGGALSWFDALIAGLSDAQRWALLTFLAALWVYLTARPGVLGGAVDAYVLAPLQLALGRRSLKMGDFVLGERIGEGSFGVVYYGAVAPRDGTVIEERAGRARTSLQMDDRYKEKVILKKVGIFADLLRSPVRWRKKLMNAWSILSDQGGNGGREGVRRLRGVVQLPRLEGGAGFVRRVPRELRRRQDQVGVRQGRQMARVEV
jgi:hypothetical protein